MQVQTSDRPNTTPGLQRTMTDRDTRRVGEVITFGDFSLFPTERLLLRAGEPVPLGSRALDILVALVRRAGQPIDKRTLLAEAWPDVTVEEGSLRFQMAGLRKALGDGEEGARYVATLPGRGYCFVAPLSRSGGDLADEADVPAPAPGPELFSAALGWGLPDRLGRTIGREGEARAIATQLLANRFVTITGSGGTGKTTVAVGIAYDLLTEFAGAVAFVDLGALRDPALAPTAVASTLGLSVQSDDPTSGLVAYLRGRRACLILDNCEHVIDAISALAARLFAGAPRSHILATSREALRAEGETVHRLSPLATPPEGSNLTAAATLTFAAPQLFVERAAAQGAPLNLSDADARIVAEICRKLDGVPLAIELAAGRMEAYGLVQIAALLGERLTLLWGGQRGARARHQTLQATLDWSYDLLSTSEQRVLCRLAVFVGHFTLDAARAVASDSALDEAVVLLALEGLVAKSLIATDRSMPEVRYRLLDTTRAYAFEKLLAADGVAAAAERHAAYYNQWLEQILDVPMDLLGGPERAARAGQLGNVRAALGWSFGPHGEGARATSLAAGAGVFLVAMSLLAEAHRWTSQALAALAEEARGSEHEMRLCSAFGLATMFARGNNTAARSAFERGLQIAEELGDDLSQLRLLGRLQLFHERIGDFRGAMVYAQRCLSVARALDDPEALAAAHAFVGTSHHMIGEQVEARAEFEAALRASAGSKQIGPTYFGFDHRLRAKVGLARTLWLQGHARQAVRTAHDMVVQADGTEHAVTRCITLIWAVSVLLWNGDFDDAEAYVDRFIALAEAHSLKPYQLIGRGVKGELDIRRGDIERGAPVVQDSLRALHAAHYEMVTSSFNAVLAEALAASGREAQAFELIAAAIRGVEAGGDLYSLPEMLRIQARVRLAMAEPDWAAAETDLLSALEWSGRQGALAWELRAATDLAALWAERGQRDRAAALLSPVLAWFEADLHTPDVERARALGRALQAGSPLIATADGSNAS
jgi:predicted ATPase/DNA-binding winged helix-turn-helix (wHTH) protein